MSERASAPKFPESKWLLIPAVLLILLINYLIICEGELKWGILIGLLLDGLGASLLAVPDVPLLWRRTFSGQLQYAKDSLQRTGAGGFSTLSRPGISASPSDNSTGFLELIDILEPILEDGLGEHTHNIYFIEKDLKTSDIDQIQSTDSNDISLFEHSTDVDKTGYGGWTSEVNTPETAAFFIPKNRVDQRLTQWITSQESRIRRTGLGLLIVGFTQQFLFYLL